tara:strand:- start:607 stop:1797 length:1191 start_codon:yes stop_codon:yes gene_type:complete
MSNKKKAGALTAAEKRVVKALLKEGMRNQDIQDLVNRGRVATINSGRITEVKKNTKQRAASDDELERYKLTKTFYDPSTGLNDIDDERIIRSREAMIMAVQIFNSPSLHFRTELFAVLCNIAWTYLLHQYHEKTLNESITKQNGDTRSLYELLQRENCPLSANVKKNLLAIKSIRDNVEHKMFGRSDSNWLGLFQACCVNYENAICDLFGPKLSLQSNLGFALQFSRIALDQIAESQELAIPANIRTLDARLNEDFDENDPAASEYKFQVVYTLDASKKSGSNFRFVSPGSDEGKEIHNILVKAKAADEMYPYKPGAAVQQVKNSVPQFTSHTHQLAWKKHKARPASGAKKPEDTDRKYAIYHSAHGDYTYSEEWVKFLSDEYSSPQKLAKLRSGE